ncbi:glutathione peroxidase [Vairimorpha necatrix]|uniref:Glutathione peroxidase n=1 Tax=Vairimorpha necatrix TaxID=6039 RepID=A0AAX4JD16_9MICR
MSDFYSLSALDTSKSLVDLSSYKDNLLIISNVASDCGLTKSNYTSFKLLIDEYYDKGLRILLFPCSQFLNQESGDIESIKKRVEEISPKLILFDKIDVMGSKQDPIFKYLRSNEPSGWFNFVKWNFMKWVVKDGKVLKRFGPTEIIKSEDISQYFSK